jgi:hypothetical protein
MTVWVLTTCHTQYTLDSSMQLHRWIEKCSKVSCMMCGVHSYALLYYAYTVLQYADRYRQFGTNWISVLLSVESQTVHT